MGGTTMTTERDLLRAITREPDDGAPRLVYSDWLEEQGQAERAEFIRSQLQLAGLAEDLPRRRELAFRCRQLLDNHENQWLDPLGVDPTDWSWSRGFVEVIDLDPDSLKERRTALFQTCPVRRLILCDLLGELDALELVPADNRLTALELLGNILAPQALQGLPRFEQFAGLAELNLAFNRLDDSAVDFLCGEPFFQDLSLLQLACNPFTEQGRQRLRDHFGGRVSFARERYLDRLYAIRDERLRVGWGHDLTQLLMVPTPEQIRVAVFDHAGNLLRIERTEVPQAPGLDNTERERRRTEARDAKLKELGYRSATIKVKRFTFEPDPGGVYAFADDWCNEFDRPRQPGVRGRPQPGSITGCGTTSSPGAAGAATCGSIVGPAR